jgi:hypothetical protein
VFYTYSTKDMKILSDEIEKIADDLGAQYVRAININDLNQVINNTRVDGLLVVYADMAEIEKIEAETNFTYFEVGAKIFALAKNTKPDPTAEEIDTLLAPCFALSYKVFSALSKSNIVYLNADVQLDNIKSTESIELLDDVLSGYEMNLIVPIQSGEGYCPDGQIFDLIDADNEDLIDLDEQILIG